MNRDHNNNNKRQAEGELNRPSTTLARTDNNRIGRTQAPSEASTTRIPPARFLTPEAGVTPRRQDITPAAYHPTANIIAIGSSTVLADDPHALVLVDSDRANVIVGNGSICVTTGGSTIVAADGGTVIAASRESVVESDRELMNAADMIMTRLAPIGRAMQTNSVMLYPNGQSTPPSALPRRVNRSANMTGSTGAREAAASSASSTGVGNRIPREVSICCTE